MIGLGTQDNSDQAVQFVENGGIVSFPMYWDEPFVSWEAFGVRSQRLAELTRRHVVPSKLLLAGVFFALAILLMCK